MAEELIQLSIRREEKERRIREELQSMMGSTITPSQSNVQERPAAAAETEAELAAKESALINEAIKESLKCFEIEKSKAVRNDDEDDDEFEAALLESMRSYREECWRCGEGSIRSRGEAGPSSYRNNYYRYGVFDSDSGYGF